MIKFDKVTKKFPNGTTAVSDISFSVADKEFVFLTGTVGAGKSTLFRLLIREILPSQGIIKFNDWNITKLPSSKIYELRRKIGVIFQELKLLLDRSVAENVSLALEIQGLPEKEIKTRIQNTLELVGLGDAADKFPVQLSGGELQRTAIARAIIKKPEVVLADEPTGNLDPATSWGIIKLLTEINKMGTTVIMATHNQDIVNSMGQRVITLEKGIIIKDEKMGKY